MALLQVKDPMLNYFLQWPTMIRMIATVGLIAPLGFFLGMPFALGIAGSFEKGSGAVGWAWAVNGLCTVLGSITCIIAAIYVGFTVTLMVAFGLYVLAGILLPRFSGVGSGTCVGDCCRNPAKYSVWITILPAPRIMFWGC